MSPAEDGEDPAADVPPTPSRSTRRSRRRERPRGEDGQALPTTRVARAATIGRLAAGQAARQAGTRVVNLGRDDEARAQAMSRDQVRAAEQIVDVLGTMKGAAMKVGQVLSFLDVGLVPEEDREQFQKKLAKLRDAAPNVSFKDMRRVIEKDAGEKLGTRFAAFEEEPLGAASIGQVYRATLHETPAGWRWPQAAVKVQYPGIDAAVRADLQNLGMILRLAKSVAPGLDVQAVGREVRERTEEELDYELEAGNQRRMARIFRDHPFCVVPGVATELCSPHVIVGEFVEGEGFEEWKARPQEERDRLAEIVFRFSFSSLWVHGWYSMDPHPGNYLRRPDGTVAFLDFGLFREMPAAAREAELQMHRLGFARDAAALKQHLVDIRWIGDPERTSEADVLRFYDDTAWWYARDEVVELDPAQATTIAMQVSNPQSSHFATLRHSRMPVEHLAARRLEGLTMAVVSQLRARVNYHRIVREWTHGDPPSTELGELEAAWRAARR